MAIGHEICTCEDVLESKLDVAGVQSGGFDEGEVVIA
jgi:hypothetical protein